MQTLIDLISSNLVEVISTSALGIYVIIANRFRTISDKNMIQQFESFKSISKMVQEKNWSVSSTVENVEAVTKAFVSDFEGLKQDILGDLDEVKKIINDFKESDVMNELKATRDELKELKKIYNQEVKEKQYYQKLIKTIEKKLGGLDV